MMVVVGMYVESDLRDKVYGIAFSGVKNRREPGKTWDLSREGRIRKRIRTESKKRTEGKNRVDGERNRERVLYQFVWYYRLSLL